MVDIANSRVISPRQVSAPQVRTARGEPPNASAGLWRAEDEKSVTLVTSPNDFLLRQDAGDFDNRELGAEFLTPWASGSPSNYDASWDGLNDANVPVRSMALAITPNGTPVVDTLAGGATEYLGSATFFPTWTELSTLPDSTGVGTVAAEVFTINQLIGFLRVRLIFPRSTSNVPSVDITIVLEQRPSGGSFSDVALLREVETAGGTPVSFFGGSGLIAHPQDASYRIRVSRPAGAALTLTLTQPTIEYRFIVTNAGLLP